MAHNAALIFLCIFTVYGFIRMFNDILDFFRMRNVRKMSSAVIKITNLPSDGSDRDYAVKYYCEIAQKLGIKIES